jgi:dipeptidyl aminopeptidase/acylaminoacyl peptidase
MKPMCVWIYPSLALVAGGAGLAAAEGRRMEIADLHKIVRVADPHLAPDGKSIVCVVSRANVPDDRWDSELVLVEIPSGQRRSLTYGRNGASSPRWSPRGDRLAFIAEAGAGKDAKPQIFVLPMAGGEARKISDATTAVEQFAWRPDGRDLAYVAADEPPNKKSIEAHDDAFEVEYEDYLATERAPTYHLWLVSADGGAPRRLTSGSPSLTTGEFSIPIAWSPDGKSLLFTQQPRSSFGAFDQARVQILDVESGQLHPLGDDKAFSSHAVFSPDGSRISFWRPRDGDFNNENEIMLASAAGGGSTDLTRALDRDVLHATWMPDGKSLLVGGMDGTRVALWNQPVNGAATPLDLGEVSPSWSFSVDADVGRDGGIVFAGSEPRRPTELYYIAAGGTAVRRLTDFNHEIAGLDLGAREAIEWSGPDGFREDGVLTLPPDFDKAKKYPLVLLIHGGPQAASTTSFNSLAHLMAARGWVVFSPNYRGSDNRGNAYQRAIFNDAGAGPGRDVMAGLAHVQSRGFVDAGRIAVSGWSYGGYMTSWLIGHYPGWKAAVSGAAVNDLVESYALGDFNVVNRYGFPGFASPYVGNNLKAYRDQSPITSAAAIKTPTLILSDTGDARVPITQSYQMYHALKDNGVPVKFVAYPVPGHFPRDPVRAADVDKRWIEWLAEYIK